MPNKVPMRMCVICRTMHEKADLLRLVHEGDMVTIDETGKKQGRGTYVCKDAACIEKCVKKRLLDRVFKQKLSDDVYIGLQNDYARLTKNK